MNMSGVKVLYSNVPVEQVSTCPGRCYLQGTGCGTRARSCTGGCDPVRDHPVKR